MSRLDILVKEPVERLTNDIVNNNSNLIFLTGVEGSGKTTVLDNLKNNKNSQDKQYVDVSPYYHDLIVHAGPETYKLYQTCLVIEKSLLSIITNYPHVAGKFEKFYFFIVKLIQHINIIHIVGVYDDDFLKTNFPIFRDITYDNLLNDFLTFKELYLKNVKLTLIFDSFDKVASTYPTYQKHIYNLLKDKLSMIIAVSDFKVLKNPEPLNDIGDIIKVNYNMEDEIIKDILNKYSINEQFSFGCLNLKYRLPLILSDDAISRLILETKGNILEMKMAIHYLYNKIALVGECDYEKEIFQFVKNNTNSNLIGRGCTKRERCLRII